MYENQAQKTKGLAEWQNVCFSCHLIPNFVAKEITGANAGNPTETPWETHREKGGVGRKGNGRKRRFSVIEGIINKTR